MSTIPDPPNDAIVLYDLPSHLSPMAWSPNTWKTRLILNYKHIPYRTVWIEYPDIEPTWKAWGVRPSAGPPNPRYTVPVISIPNASGKPTFVVESFEIAIELDRLYPEKPLFPPGSHGLQAVFRTLNFRDVNAGFWPILIPLALDHLRPGSLAFYRRTREERFGDLLEWCPVGSEKRENAWEELKKGLDVIDDAIRRNQGAAEDGWVMGDTMSFADFGVASELIWLSKIGLKEDWERVSGWHGGRWKRLVEEKLKDYLEVVE